MQVNNSQEHSLVSGAHNTANNNNNNSSSRFAPKRGRVHTVFISNEGKNPSVVVNDAAGVIITVDKQQQQQQPPEEEGKGTTTFPHPTTTTTTDNGEEEGTEEVVVDEELMSTYEMVARRGGIMILDDDNNNNSTTHFGSNNTASLTLTVNNNNNNNDNNNTSTTVEMKKKRRALSVFSRRKPSSTQQQSSPSAHLSSTPIMSPLPSPSLFEVAGRSRSCSTAVTPTMSSSAASNTLDAPHTDISSSLSTSSSTTLSSTNHINTSVGTVTTTTTTSTSTSTLSKSSSSSSSSKRETRQHIVPAKIAKTTLIREGKPRKQPTDNCRCRINYTVQHKISKSEMKMVEQMDHFNLIIGDGDISPLLEDCLRMMKPTEMSIFLCTILKVDDRGLDYCHRHSNQFKQLLQTPGSTLEIIIELDHCVTEEEEWWSYMIQHTSSTFNGFRMLSNLVQQKQKEAKALIMEERNLLAIKRLEKAFDLLESYSEASPFVYQKKQAKIHKYAISLLFDIVNAYSLMGDHSNAISTCNTILCIDRKNIDAVLARANAYKAKNNLSRASADFMHALEFTTDRIARNHISDMLQRISESRQKYSVSVTSTVTKGERTYYNIRIQNEVLNIDFAILKRYSEFQKLYDDLSKKSPKLSTEISFPQGKWFRSFSNSVINDRRDKFDTMLKHLISSPVYSQMPEVIDFLMLK